MQSRAQAKGGPQPPAADTQPNHLTVTGQQRAYLDALKATGMKPSSDLQALSIGSYVCQARAAKQSDQAVRDYVTPLVRNDVRNTQLNGAPPPEPAVVRRDRRLHSHRHRTTLLGDTAQPWPPTVDVSATGSSP